jgi:predicted nucleic acid-binding protein/predicted nucleotidyltransferase
LLAAAPNRPRPASGFGVERRSRRNADQQRAVILVDTTAWIEFLRDTGSAVCARVDELLDDEVASCHPVRMGLLAGASDEQHLSDLRGLLARCSLIPTEPTDYEEAAALYRACRRGGETVRRLIDCLIGATAIRTVSRLAGASVQQTATVIAELVSLGMVTRRDAGSSALVGLERENEAVGAVLALGHVGERVMERLRDSAQDIAPQPASLIVFGSFARGDARLTSDLDVLAVRPIGLSPDENTWLDSLGKWESNARRIVGNPVHTLVVSQEELEGLMRRRSGPWRAIAAEGVTLLGSSLSSHASVAP